MSDTFYGENNPFDPVPEPGNDPGPAAESDDTEGKNSAARQDSQTARLLALAEERFTLIKDTVGDVYGVDRDRPGIALPLDGKNGVAGELRRLYYDETNRAAPATAIADTLSNLDAKGTRCETPTPIYLRFGQTAGGKRVIDLGTDDGAAIVLDSSGWQVAASSPVFFRRNKATNPMPRPISGGSLDRFRALINTDDDGFRLLVAWMLVALCDDVQSPILCLIGQQGSAKTSCLRSVIGVVAPSGAPLTSPPRDEDSWSLTANASPVIGIDNLSTVPLWFSDVLARTVSGDAVIKRALYSNQDITITSYRRAVAITSISPEGLRADVADRLCTVELNVIPKSGRRLDRELAAEFREIHAETLGALLDLLVQVERALETITPPTELPRLADAGLMLHALDYVTGWDTLGSFIESQDNAAEDVLDADVFAAALIAFARERGVWEGTASEVLRAISPERPPRAWPRNAQAAGARLQRLAPPLVQAGVHVEQRERTMHGRGWRITYTPQPGERLCEVCRQPLHESLPDSITVHATCAESVEEHTNESEPLL
ncbi:hypothetical protein [Dietzia timorensis]|uniref:ATP-binding protein n=1 Tax=Dietzia timorensis TaxID=499555 RepID=A0A173LKZ1_9ACTN|nr:hypothetical protein [Dietzia timorensis]ANI91260.1 Hypothetical protein BJL86_0453 [Dietzia timorensis]